MPTDAMDPAYSLAEQIARLKIAVEIRDDMIMAARAKLAECNEEVRRLRAEAKPARRWWQKW